MDTCCEVVAGREEAVVLKVSMSVMEGFSGALGSEV